ncbi:hypothetical protein [Streptomyces uncialis]|uniref:Uncharacterized protein n=1 Tax=Streptomyces uncialis TaxID=1048205 RepID=A0A1Q4UZY4_9ACTN|nr:hypothetical protein [Streptomyces uncialis]OKH91123.1 hypothetical protein AB852_32195 [Streptomyces uncialis]
MTAISGERAAVAALIEEGDVLARGDVRDLLVVENEAFPRLVPLWKVEVLGDRRLGIVLRALARLAGADSVAVGCRSRR